MYKFKDLIFLFYKYSTNIYAQYIYIINHLDSDGEITLVFVPWIPACCW